MSRQKIKKEATKKDILNSALELFSTIGYEKTTIDEIVKKADVAKGTFYYHFKAKEDIVFEIMENSFLELKSEINNKIKLDESPITLLKELMQYFTEWTKNNPNIAKFVLLQKLSNLNQAVSNANYESRNDDFRTLLSTLLEKAQEKNLITKKIHSHELSIMLSMMLVQAIVIWNYDPQTFLLEDRVENCLKVFFNGILEQ